MNVLPYVGDGALMRVVKGKWAFKGAGEQSESQRAALTVVKLTEESPLCTLRP